MKTYRLGSSGFIYAPGVVRFAIHGYRISCDRRDRTVALRLIAEGWGVPKAAAVAMLSGKAEHTVEGDTVVFTA
jgi:hypothetical protein